MFINRTIKDYLDRLSSEQPIPGGGGTSALVGALGIGLIIMVAKIMAGRPEHANDAKLKELIQHLIRLRDAAERIVDEDPKVFQDVMNSYKQIKKIQNKKIGEENLETALGKAFRIQADLCSELTTAKKILVEVGKIATKSIRNDLVVANALLDAAFKGGESTAHINVVCMEKGKKCRHAEHELEKTAEQYQKIKFE
ncbi:MAG: hypothetical protein A3G33_05675 [Omnitrophica bacterium RIFCSPLOWO2_12_FULL_44_17]|uniref:Cyclodeaminase/cyclohydrolase domain-containing protein n=1 Tax=Candidatus Danuiimicrobium aquiferis TaxID=1801832 RepID=A0A1G1L307_9BACT|nr:MAG: hypothetical protein A3B72_05155 [Omnitrophica bacterium RIFCSPHIGHO2_02_FULL_45_28]OGW92281.1 MAG: hypothetical protein A3E74_09360 [Omnitrophica bacterium RIFCSPHIGHO2_12_FULL_44_12]OGW99560.1 MAG: hypothetical protein A3G33_05675 [Omnitrophica bacterium RIFCSPLOWO2_12_FULL_44_17]OGX04009.1 MAG: hypothetical protein A3J12_06215 [Omnitrophica bacterium RIFCSPLOWO2_02_FULL_44_11]